MERYKITKNISENMLLR